VRTNFERENGQVECEKGRRGAIPVRDEGGGERGRGAQGHLQHLQRAPEGGAPVQRDRVPGEGGRRAAAAHAGPERGAVRRAEAGGRVGGQVLSVGRRGGGQGRAGPAQRPGAQRPDGRAAGGHGSGGQGEGKHRNRLIAFMWHVFFSLRPLSSFFLIKIAMRV